MVADVADLSGVGVWRDRSPICPISSRRYPQSPQQNGRFPLRTVVHDEVGDPSVGSTVMALLSWRRCPRCSCLREKTADPFGVAADLSNLLVLKAHDPPVPGGNDVGHGVEGKARFAEGLPP